MVQGGYSRGSIITPDAHIQVSTSMDGPDHVHCMGVLPDRFAVAYGVSRRSGDGELGPASRTWANSLFYGHDLVNIGDWLCCQKVEEEHQDRYHHIIDALSRIIGQPIKMFGSRLCILDDVAGYVKFGFSTPDTVKLTLCWVVDVLARWLQTYPDSEPNFIHTMDPTILVDGFDVVPMYGLKYRLQQVMPNAKFIVSMIGG
jgi:hypothetical protein